MTVFIYPREGYGGRVTTFAITEEGKVLSRKNSTSMRFAYGDVAPEVVRLEEDGHTVRWVDEETPEFQTAKKVANV